jgi:acetyl-CoA carboxylase biotin carboxylase subunit
MRDKKELMHFLKKGNLNGVSNLFKKVLIANRGEIAVRIIKACQEMGIKTVAIYSDVDKNAIHVQLADESINLGDPTPSESYLNIQKIIKIAKDTGSEAIHPGYGFLAENPDFAQSCKDVGIKFIGPSSKVISLMGDKIAAKTTMEKADVPVIPGYHGLKQDNETLIKEGKKIGFPLLVKATAGGGGKGMRIVHSENLLEQSIESAKRESKSAFGDDSVFLEKYLDKPRHIEFQILADEHGNVIHLFERECSVQRRHQKIIEETPSPVMKPELRDKMGKAAVAAAEAVGYTNAGTVEFMIDENLNFYFMEMNTRLQVEHPITEATTGIDLAKWQLRIASEEKLTLKQKDITQRGHAIECRIYAEDPSNGFLPSTGTLSKVEPPKGPNIRDDTGIYSGMKITPYYDPLLSKLVVYAENRNECLNKMIWAISRYIVLGVTTNITFLNEVLKHEEFRKGNITTHFIEEHFKDWTVTKDGLPIDAIISLAVYDSIHTKREEIIRYKEKDPHSPWKHVGRWRVGGRGI